LWRRADVWFMYEQVFLKEGGESRRTPWHQDSSYLPIDGSQIAVMWISFDPVAKNDSLEFVRGSHRGVMYDGSRFDPNDDTAPIYGDGSLPRLPNIEAERSRWDIVSWAVEPGDVLVFHPGVLHGGAATHRGTRRRTLSLRFFGEDAVYALRPGMSGKRRPVDDPEASVFARAAAALSPGDPLCHPGFPKLRPS
jgi:ectoine hydroxylase-related dioxygenase (phytanoyl-CoA dioxygenase family)